MNEWDDVLIVMEIMQQQGLCQEKSTYRSCLQSCFKHANGSSASEILEAMEKAMVQPDPVDISLVVATMCKNEHTEDGWWQKALTLLKSSATTIATERRPGGSLRYGLVVFGQQTEPLEGGCAVAVSDGERFRC